MLQDPGMRGMGQCAFIVCEIPMQDTPYAQIGGEVPVRTMIDRFYDLMDTAPEYYVIRKLHPADLSGSRKASSRLSEARSAIAASVSPR